jgi:hypothetical protein
VNKRRKKGIIVVPFNGSPSRHACSAIRLFVFALLPFLHGLPKPIIDDSQFRYFLNDPFVARVQP